MLSCVTPSRLEGIAVFPALLMLMTVRYRLHFDAEVLYYGLGSIKVFVTLEIFLLASFLLVYPSFKVSESECMCCCCCNIFSLLTFRYGKDCTVEVLHIVFPDGLLPCYSF